MRPGLPPSSLPLDVLPDHGYGCVAGPGNEIAFASPLRLAVTNPKDRELASKDHEDLRGHATNLLNFAGLVLGSLPLRGRRNAKPLNFGQIETKVLNKQTAQCRAVGKLTCVGCTFLPKRNLAVHDRDAARGR